MPPRLAVVWIVCAASVLSQGPVFAPSDELIPQGPAYLEATDLDGDGIVDLLAGSPADSALGDGTGRFAPGWNATNAPELGFADDLLVSAPHAYEDFNGDGVRDLIYASGSTTFKLRLGLMGGGFAAADAQTVPTGSVIIKTMTAGDIDGDGDVDVVVTGIYSGGPFGPYSVNPPLLWVNSGAGVFSSALMSTSTSLLSPTQGRPTLVDLDGDGDVDLLLSDGYWYKRNSTSPGLFGGLLFSTAIALPPAGVSATGFSQPCAVGDFDGDGLLDVARQSAAGSFLPPNQVWIARQTAPGVFAATGAVPVNAPPLYSAPIGGIGTAAADMDGDGVSELIVCDAAGVRVFAGTGGGAAVATIPKLVAHEIWPADVDQDGDLDLIAATYVSVGSFGYRVVFGDGALGFHWARGGLDRFPTRLAVSTGFTAGDFDGDGAIDAFGLNEQGTPFVATNDGDGLLSSFVAVPSATTSAPVWPILFAFDHDGDGRSDVVAARTGPTGVIDWLLTATSGGGFTRVAMATTPGASMTNAVAAGDLDADGDVDLLVASNALTYVRYDVGGPPSAGVPLPAGTGGVSVDLADFDDDGDKDVVVARGANGTSFVVNLLNAGGGFAAGATITGAAADAVARDFDGDGLTDLVSGNQLRLRTGPFVFAPPVTLPTILASDGMTAADADGDGDLDLFASSGAVLVNQGGGVFAAAPPIDFTAAPPVIWSVYKPVVADFDRDGDVDAVVPGPVLLSNRQRQLSIRHRARPNSWFGFDVYGAPTAPWLLAVGMDPLPNPPIATPWGRLVLDPSSAVIVAVGITDANGFGFADAFLTASLGTTLLGTTFVLQAAVEGPSGARITAARRSTVVPF